MPDLAGTQARFAAALTDAAAATTAVDLFRCDPATATRRLAIYRGNVQANAIRALQAAYPVVRRIVGDEFFEGLAVHYARAQPSSDGDLNRFGDRLPDFLSAFEPARDLPYLPDVAQLEWAVHRSHYAADAMPFDPATLAVVPPQRQGDLQIRLHPAVALVQSPWPVARIWEIHQPDFEGEFAVEPVGGGQRALVYRPRWRVAVRPASPGEQAFLAAGSRGATLDVAVSRALVADPGFDLGSRLPVWVAEGVLAGLDLPP